MVRAVHQIIGIVLADIAVAHLHAAVSQQLVEVGVKCRIQLVIGEVQDVMTVLIFVDKPVTKRLICRFIKIRAGLVDDHELTLFGDTAALQINALHIVSVHRQPRGKRGSVALIQTGQNTDGDTDVIGDLEDRRGHALLHMLRLHNQIPLLLIGIGIIAENVGRIKRRIILSAGDQQHMRDGSVHIRIGR